MTERYGQSGTRSGSETTLGTLFLEAGSGLRRIHVYDVMLGFTGTVADESCSLIARHARGTAPAGSAVTPAPLNVQAGAPAADCDTLQTLTTNPGTIDSVPALRMTMNSRSGGRWVASPGSELVVPGVANDGLLFTQAVDTSMAKQLHVLHAE